MKPEACFVHALPLGAKDYLQAPEGSFTLQIDLLLVPLNPAASQHHRVRGGGELRGVDYVSQHSLEGGVALQGCALSAAINCCFAAPAAVQKITCKHRRAP